MRICYMFLLGILFLMNACTPVLVGGAGAGGYYVGKDERPAGTIASDAAITSKINALFLAEKGISTFNIDVDTYNGVVTLYGKVSSSVEASKAVTIAKNVKGVKRVVSKLSVTH